MNTYNIVQGPDFLEKRKNGHNFLTKQSLIRQIGFIMKDMAHWTWGFILVHHFRDTLY